MCGDADGRSRMPGVEVHWHGDVISVGQGGLKPQMGGLWAVGRPINEAEAGHLARFTQHLVSI